MNGCAIYHVRHEHHLECVLVGAGPTSHRLDVTHALWSNLYTFTWPCGVVNYLVTSEYTALLAVLPIRSSVQ